MTTQAQSTEAACLLQSGALYLHRVGLFRSSGGDMVFAGVKKAAFSLYFGDEPIYHFDLDGRWQRAFVDGTHFLKSLDTSVWAIGREREGPNLVLRRRRLDPGEVLALDRQIRGVALGLFDELHQGRLRRQEPSDGRGQPLNDEELGGLLARITARDAAAWRTQRSLYTSTYETIPFLPPDSQNALVIQATRGQAGGFRIGGERATEPLVRTTEQFEDHLQNVARLMGRRLLQARLAFLAGSDVLRLGPDDLNRYLEILGRRFVIAPKAKGQPVTVESESPRLEGVHTFVDDFSPPLPGLEALRGYRERHLLHVSLGVESGDRDVLEQFGKHWLDADLRGFVSDLHSAGIGCSLLTLVGAGGVNRCESHRERTVELLSSLGLARGDTIFLLDEREFERTPAAEDGAELLGGARDAHQARFKDALSPLRQQGIKVLPYSLEKQWA